MLPNVLALLGRERAGKMEPGPLSQDRSVNRWRVSEAHLEVESVLRTDRIEGWSKVWVWADMASTVLLENPIRGINREHDGKVSRVPVKADGRLEKPTLDRRVSLGDR